MGRKKEGKMGSFSKWNNTSLIKKKDFRFGQETRRDWPTEWMGGEPQPFTHLGQSHCCL